MNTFTHSYKSATRKHKETLLPVSSSQPSPFTSFWKYKYKYKYEYFHKKSARRGVCKRRVWNFDKKILQALRCMLWEALQPEKGDIVPY